MAGKQIMQWILTFLFDGDINEPLMADMQCLQNCVFGRPDKATYAEIYMLTVTEHNVSNKDRKPIWRNYVHNCAFFLSFLKEIEQLLQRMSYCVGKLLLESLE